MKIINIFFLPLLNNGYIKNKNDFFINREISITLSSNNTIINKLNGFYGLIGADIDKNVKNLYDIVMGNGVIQGIYFDKDNITFVRNYVKTDKLLSETYDKSNRFDLSNVFDLSNTNILQVNNRLFTLFERNTPYEINIDNRTIKTIGRINKKIYFSGHSKYRNEKIETVDYQFLEKYINYHIVDKNLEIEKTVKINLKYKPIIHDFGIYSNKRIFLDAPFEINMLKMSVYLDKKNVFIHVLNKDTNEIDIYEIDKSFYIFHYSIVEEKDDNIIIYVPIYDTIHFSNLDLHARYRRIIINKKTKNSYIEKNMELEKYNLDFPVLFEDKVILRNIIADEKRINGFVICKDLEIVKTLFYDNISICGEPVLKYIDNIPYLLFFGNSTDNSYFMMLDLFNYTIEYLLIPYPLQIGFHSIFIDNK